MSIEFITGPMFAGKSTYLANKILSLRNNNKNNMLIINYKNDKPYNDKGHLSTHNKVIIESIGIEDCNEINNYLTNYKNKNNINDINYIIIDEVQFIKNIYEWVILNKNKYYIYMSGLNYDVFYNYFNNNIKNIINDTNIKKIYLTATCFKCKSTNANYTYLLKKPKNNNLSPSNNTCVGGKDIYQPICENCKTIL
jgi:thymidine kinase